MAYNDKKDSSLAVGQYVFLKRKKSEQPADTNSTG